ncbi:AbrB/MazE/SpoVT family DNA-binding domain-containing protein [Notoacmeibacter marinus]|uniref:AbrB/MazE/SpoVT family DNA-binding domain-containing protein n=1 Tax=Notoacmeibacter marinus TaxID=1876515 RepID=UPI000DF41755|nr:AbrB/MazE/SpoVT family DNA-binding domain-containing protein [Notoacmeibacter marinus]
MPATVTVKGQVTIPKPVRDLLGLKPGSKVDFRRNTEGDVVLKPAGKKREKSRIAAFRGHAGEGMDTDAIMALTRDPASRRDA